MTHPAPDDAVARKVIEIIARQAVLDPADVTLEATPESLGLDSLSLVETIFAIEEAFDLAVPFNANDPSQSDFDVSSVARVIEAVKALDAARSG